MWPGRYFARRYFAPRYFAKVGANAGGAVGAFHLVPESIAFKPFTGMY